MTEAAENPVNPFMAEWVYKPAPSGLLTGFILISHISSILALVLLPGLVWWAKLLLSLLVAGSLLYSLLLHNGYWLARRVDTLYWRTSGGWELQTAAGEHVPVIFSGASFSSRFITLLNFRTRAALGGRRFTVILLPDNSDALQRRYLRMRLNLLVWAKK